MKSVISASRRTDLVAFFADWLSAAIRTGKAQVPGPRKHVITADLRPESVHTVVLWSKDFGNLIENKSGLRDALEKYAQIYFHFTITGLGGSFIERNVPLLSGAIQQLQSLIRIAGHPERVSLRFDPVIFWNESGKRRTNLAAFETLAGETSSLGIKDVRISFAQWYGKAVRRAAKHGFDYFDPSPEEKITFAAELVRIAQSQGLSLYSCAQNFLAKVSGFKPSSCIDGRLLQRLHPMEEPVSTKKDKTQRPECGCTESVDIGSYSQVCSHGCLYCYANPKI